VNASVSDTTRDTYHYSEEQLPQPTLMVSLSNHERSRWSFDRFVLSETLILRQAQDEQ